MIACINGPFLFIANISWLWLYSHPLQDIWIISSFYCSSLTRGQLALLQAAERWEFLARSQVLSSFSVIMYAQHGERPALRQLAFQLWLIPILQVFSGMSAFLRSFCVDNHLPGQPSAAPIIPCVLCICNPGSEPSMLH